MDIIELDDRRPLYRRWFMPLHEGIPSSAIHVSLQVFPFVSSSNNGRRMRGNVSVSTTRPPRFHYYTHKSCPQCLDFLRSVLIPSSLCACLDDKTWNTHMFQRDSVFPLNNRPSQCQRQHLCSPGAALTTVIKKLMAWGPLWAFCIHLCHLITVNLVLYCPPVFKYMFYAGVGVLMCQ